MFSIRIDFYHQYTQFGATRNFFSAFSTNLNSNRWITIDHPEGNTTIQFNGTSNTLEHKYKNFIWWIHYWLWPMLYVCIFSYIFFFLPIDILCVHFFSQTKSKYLEWYSINFTFLMVLFWFLQCFFSLWQHSN